MTVFHTSTMSAGRLGNMFIQNMAMSFLAKLYNIPIVYSEHDKFTSLGLTFFTEGSNEYSETEVLNNQNYEFYLENGPRPHTFRAEWQRAHIQIPSVAIAIRKSIEEQWTSIVKRNVFRSRYNNNNDLFLQVRLDDAADQNPGLEYFERQIELLTFDNGYIATDSPDHEIVKTLWNKYKLTPVSTNEVNTIKFGSTCKHIILSGGTFSWTIGVFARFSDVYYPKNRENRFCGDIFIFPEWKGI